MTISGIYAGAEQSDVAMLTNSSGITMWCFVWLAGGGSRVEAKIFTETEDGALVLVDAAIVASAIGDSVDCPRVLAAGETFVVHWIDMETSIVGDASIQVDGADLYRSLFVVTDIAAGWVNQGAVQLHTTLQYDHAIVIGASDNGFIIARRTAADTIAFARYQSPWGWTDTTWTSSQAGLTIAATVLACHAHEGDDVLLISYQDTLLLRTFRRNASTGTTHAIAETFADLLDGDNHFTAVGHVRVATDRYLVVAEVWPDSLADAGYQAYLRLVAWRQIVGTSAAVEHESQWCHNVHMLSRPWAWAGGTTGTIEAFCALSFKSIADGQEFDQQYGYVARLDVAALAGANAAGVVRPVPCSAIMGGSIDARPHGRATATANTLSIGVRLNHLSHAAGPPAYTLGPNVTTKRFACARWGQLKSSQDSDADTELQPVMAGVGWVLFTHEPESTIRRDTLQPTQPDTPAWRGASRALSLPVESPVGLVLSGGVTQAYDGEQMVENGFLWAPEIVDIEVTAMGGSATDLDGLEYHYYVNYIWPDNRGGVHRSGPSRPVSAVLNDSGFVTLRVRCANLSMKDDSARYPTCAPIAIEVWRTYAVGGSFDTDSTGTYLFRSVFGGSVISNQELQDTPNSDPAEFFVEIVDAMSNALIANNQLAPYQLDLDSLQWVPPPPIPHQPSGCACLWQNRLFVYDTEGRSIAWSEEILPLGTRYEWPYFLDAARFRLDAVGRVVAMAPMDSALVVYTRDAIYALTGDPGAGGSTPSMSLQVITTGIGCVEPRSVVTYPEGQFFQSAKGIHKLSRGQGIEHVGAAIEDVVRAAGSVRGAVHLDDTHQIVFPLQGEPGTGPLAVRPRLATYDYRVGKWAIRTLPMLAQASTASRLNELQHAIAWRGRQGNTSLAVLAQGGLALQRSRTDTVYADVNSAGTNESVCLDIITEWFHPAGIVGQWLCDEIGIQTERVNAGPLTIQAWYNVDGRFDGTYNIASPMCTWTYDGVTNFAPAYIPFRLNALKVSWVKLRIFEPSTAPATENVRLVSLSLAWRHLTGHRRVARV
jgi:hypothetical protein